MRFAARQKRDVRGVWRDQRRDACVCDRGPVWFVLIEMCTNREKKSNLLVHRPPSALFCRVSKVFTWFSSFFRRVRKTGVTAVMHLDALGTHHHCYTKLKRIKKQTFVLGRRDKTFSRKSFSNFQPQTLN